MAATNNGNGVVWYATATSTTPLSGASGLVNGEDYFADDNSGTCGPRQSVTVSIYTAPTGQNFQGVCVDIPENATISDLIAVGNNVQWYNLPNGGVPLPATTQLIDNTIYYASQTNPNTGCQTSRLSVFVNVGVVPVPTGDPTQEFCNDPSGPAPTVGDLQASGDNNNWYITSSSAVPLDLATPLVNGQSYFATTVDPPCESSSRFEVVVTLLEPNDAGTDGSRQICQNQVASTPPFNLFGLLGGTPDNTGVWTGPLATSNGFQGTVNVSSLTLAGSPYVFTYTVTNGLCAPDTATVTITILPLPVVSIAANATICSGQTATVTFTGTPNATVTYTVNSGPNQTIVLNGTGTATLTSTYTATTTYALVSVASAGTPSCSQTQTGSVTITVLPLPIATISANATVCSGATATVTFNGTPNATVTYNINGGPNQTIVLNGTGTAIITNTYTATTVFNLVSVVSSGTPSCSRPLSGSVTITVIQLPTVTIASNVTICPNGQAMVTFTGTPNATVTYNVNGGPNQTIVLNGVGTASITANYTVTTTFNLISIATAGTPSCSRPVTGSVTITVLPLPVVAISTNTTICSGATATVTFTGTPNATVTYTVNGGPNQTIVLNGAGIATITNTYTATTTFTLVSVASAGTPSCSQPQTGAMVITVQPLPTAAISSNANVCPNGQATVTFTGTPNATVTYTVNGGPNQTIVLNGTGTATITANFSVTTTYALVSVTSSGTPSCTRPVTGSITITVLPLPVVAISANATICSGQSATVTFTGTPNATVTYNINGGPNQTIVLNGLGTATITNAYTATTTFNLVSVASSGTPSCSQPQTGSITITVAPLPVVAISANATICSGQSATVTFTGTPNATVTYNINGGPNQTIVLNGLGTATINNTYTATTTFNLVSVASSGTPSCSQPQTGSVVITVLALPVVTISANVTICSGGSATVNFTGTPNATVTYTVNGGPNQTIVLNGTGTATITTAFAVTTTYTLVSVTTSGTPSCTQPAAGSVTITVLPLPVVAITANATICSGQSATVTFTGTPNATVTYTVNGGPNQTIVLNGLGTATITNSYTATTTFLLVSANLSGCSQPQTGTVVITVIPPPVVAISVNNTTICSGDNATVTFTGTANATITYTVNGGPNQTIVLDGSGTATITNAYTATTTFTLVSATTAGTPSCSQPQTGSVTITVTPAPVAGNDVANLSLCGNATPVDLFTLLGPDAQTGGVWSPALASGTGVFNPAVDPAGTYVYTLAGTPPCLPDTASVTISIVPPPNAGNDASPNICSNASPQDLFVSLGALAQAGGVWSPAMASGTGVFNPAVDAAGAYTYTVTGVAPCGNDTATVTVQITAGPDAGLDGTLTLCVNSASQDLFDSLNGTPQVGGTWSPTLASGTGVFDPAVDAAGIYTYTFFGNQPCDNDTATVTVTINPIPDAGEDGEAFFCTNYPAADLFGSLEGTPQTGGTWSPALASGTGVFDPLVDAAGVYTYTVGGNLCTTDTAIVTVTVVQSPDAGGPGITLNACVTSTSVDLFTGLDGSQGVGTWADDNASGALSGNIFNPSLAGTGTYNFTYTVGGGVSPCLFDTATVTVIVEPIADAGEGSGLQSVCSSTGTFDLLTLLDGEQSGGIWTNEAGDTVVNPLDISGFTSGSYVFNYTVTNSCNTDVATVQLDILPAPILTIPNITLMTPICVGENATIMLNGMVDGSYAITYDLSGSNVLAAQTVSVTVAGGNASFVIPAANLANTGITTITFTNIANTVTNCETEPTNVLVNLVVNPTSNLDSADLSIANVCLGADVVVMIADASGAPFGLPDGNYQFNYSIPGAIPSTGSTGIVAIAGGAGQFTVPGTAFNVANNYTLTITGIIGLSGGCTNLSEDASASFQVFPVPNVTGATVAVDDACQNFQAEVTISNAASLADGAYTIEYALSGANVGTATATITFTGGTGSFFIPAASLANAGNTTITITQLTAGVGLCGVNGTGFNPVTFEVTQLGTPVLIPNGDEFCATDNPTIANLSANITIPDSIVWYDAPVGGTAYADTDLLQNGATYYAAFTTTAGCESAVRLEVTVDLTVCNLDIIIPDGFSPNGDNINDDFEIINLPELYPNFRLEIYNRYGNILYKGNINTPNWNGTASEGGIKMGNEEVPVGVYFFILELNDGAKKPIQGRVYLSR